ncbi:Transcriptional regulatory protein BasR [Nymphon striatum]|nr:Transcriptional regulatory protein BasR [Nymphon striatum]
MVRARDFEDDFENFKPKVCVIDLGLPDKDGLGLLHKISLERDTAVLVVSGRSSLTDKIAGLELGADDYLAKPFEMPELVARIKALLRRSNTPAPKRQSIHTVGNVTVDLSRFTLADSTGKEERYPPVNCVKNCKTAAISNPLIAPLMCGCLGCAPNSRTRPRRRKSSRRFTARATF